MAVLLAFLVACADVRSLHSFELLPAVCPPTVVESIQLIRLSVSLSAPFDVHK